MGSGVSSRAGQYEGVFAYGLDLTIDRLQENAYFIAQDQDIRNLLWRGYCSTRPDEDCPGNEQTHAVRMELLHRVQPMWKHASALFDARQLHFHFSPGVRSFLRVHRPDRFGDELSDIRHTVTTALQENSHTGGLEYGRALAGVRGVVPIPRPDDPSRAFAALEVGCSMESTLKAMNERFGVDFAILARDEFVHQIVWDEEREAWYGRHPPVPGYAVEECTTSPQLYGLLKEGGVDPSRRKLRLVSLNGRTYAVTAFPLRDFLGTRRPERHDVGVVLAWQDVSEPLAAIVAEWRHHAVLATGLFAVTVLGFLLVLRIRHQRLGQIIDRQGRELDDSRRTLRQIIESVPQGIYWKDRDGVYRGCNQTYASLRAIANPDAIIGCREYEIFHADGTAWATDHADLRVILEDQSEVGASQEVVGAGGQKRWIHSSKVPLHSPSGEVIGLLGTLEDITELKRAEESLRQSRVFLAHMVESLPLGVFTKDPQGRYLLWNRAFETITGISAEDAIGKTQHDLFPMDQADFIRQKDLEILQSGTIEDIPEVPIDTRFGTRYLHSIKVPITDDDARLQYLLAISEDITERKAVQEELEDSRRKLQQIMDHIDIGVAMVNSDLTMVSANQQLLGWFPEFANSSGVQCFGCRDKEPHTHPCHECPVRQTLEDGQNRELRLDLDRPGGLRHYRLLTTPVRNSRNEVTAVIEIVSDITDQLHSELELRQARDAAEAAALAKSQFLANMSHEIRTPMNGVMGMAELLVQTPLDPKQKGYAETILRSATSLLTVINDILDFSRIEAGKMVLDEQSFDMRELSEEVLHLVSQSSRPKEVEIMLEYPPEVPRWFRGAPVRIRQVMLNLVGNAVKFTREGYVLVRVHQRDKGWLEVAVYDTGIGIEADKIESIFDKFIQADTSTTREFGGSGLGLSICRRLVELMGGEITCHSELGEGSTFRFSLPLDDAEPVEKPPPLAAEELQGLDVLVVDDHEINRRILRDELEGWGMRVHCCSGGEEALALLAGQPELVSRLRLVLLDGDMPGMNGFELARRLTETWTIEAATLMMLKSSSLRKDSRHCEELGIDTCLLKPLREADLMEAIRQALGATQEQVLPPSRGVPLMKPERSLRVLLVEDNSVNQKLVLEILSCLGHDVVVAENGQEAIEEYANGRFDLVFMDVQMPLMGGFEATGEIRHIEGLTQRHVPIVALTAHAMSGDRERCLEAGMDDYITKPISAEDILRVVEAVAMDLGPPAGEDGNVADASDTSRTTNPTRRE